MPIVSRQGVQIATFPTRAECFLFIFAQGNLTYDQHSRKRNQLLPGVKVEGKDYEEESEQCIISE